jgi:hypothetical protein
MLLRIGLVGAALAIAAGTAVALLNDDGDGQEVAAAAPPEDKPTPQETAPGQTKPEPEPEAPIQRVEIKGRFGKACGDNGLCFEIAPPKDRGPNHAPELGPVIAETSISFNGEVLAGIDLLYACQMASMNDSYFTAPGGDMNEDRLRGFYGEIPVTTTELLQIEGMTNVAQLEVDIDSLGLRHLFYGESTTITPKDMSDYFEESRLSIAEVVEHAGRPFKGDTCEWDLE